MSLAAWNAEWKARPKLPRYIWGSKFYAKNILISCNEQKAWKFLASTKPAQQNIHNLDRSLTNFAARKLRTVALKVLKVICLNTKHFLKQYVYSFLLAFPVTSKQAIFGRVLSFSSRFIILLNHRNISTTLSWSAWVIESVSCARVYVQMTTEVLR